MTQPSKEKVLLTEIVEYGQYSINLEFKREESLIAQANQMTTAFSFSTAALYLLFQIGLQHYPALTPNFLVCAVAPITFLLLLSLFFAFLASWRWQQSAFYNVNILFKYISDNEKKFLDNDFSFLLEWKDAIAEKHEELFKLNNRRGLFIRISMWLFIFSLIIVFIFGAIAFLRIGGKM